MKSKYDLFISYKRSDGADLANYFFSELTKLGFRSFIDVKELTVGAFPKEIGNAIECADMIVLILTEDCFEKIKDDESYIKKEVDFAINKNKPIFIVSKVKDVYKKLDDNTYPIFNKLKQLNIIEYNHSHASDVLEKAKKAIENLKIEKFNFDNIIDFDSSKSNYKKEFDHNGYLYEYQGELRNEHPYDYGMMIDQIDNKRFEGVWYGWERPIFSGKGKVFIGEDLLYEGQWRKLKYHGKGKLYEEDGVYEGQFEDGEKNGIGVKIYNNENYYNGEWIHDKLTGYGEMRFGNGDHYIGQFLKGLPEGLGKYIFENGNKYDGFLLDGKPNGNGIMVYEKGYVYRGKLVRSKKQGKGELIDLNGSDVYNGEWFTDLFEGFGKFFYKNGMVYQGKWTNGIKTGNGVLLNTNGDILFKGSWNKFELKNVLDAIGSDLYKELLYEEYAVLCDLDFEPNEYYNMDVIEKFISEYMLF